MTDVNYEVLIDAAPETIYGLFTEGDGLVRWMGVDATANPVPGGSLTWTHENGAVMIGRFVELDPPHHLVFRYGWKDDLMGLAPESTIVEVHLTPTSDHRTMLRLNHRGLPEASAGEHRQGWRYFIDRLVEVVANTPGLTLGPLEG